MPFFLFVHCCAKKADTNFQLAKLGSSWSRVSVISDGFRALGINFVVIRCFICCQTIDLQLRLVLEGLAKAQAQQAQIDLR